jgi:hypothetical protein
MSFQQKRTTTLFGGFGLTAAPAAHDFVLDATYADLTVNIHAFTGTTPTIQVEVVELVNPILSVIYDAQTANYTVGRFVKGAFSNARGQIVADTDGGTTGTLELKNVQGRFRDNEPLIEEGASPGSATVNGNPTWGYVEDGQYGITAALTPAAVGSTRLDLTQPITGSPATAHLHPLVGRRMRMKFVAGGTITNLDMTVDAVQLMD